MDNYSNGNRRTLHTFFLRMIEILHILCLSLSSHCGFKSSNGRIQFVHASLLSKIYPTTAGLNAGGKGAKTIKINAIHLYFNNSKK